MYIYIYTHIIGMHIYTYIYIHIHYTLIFSFSLKSFKLCLDSNSGFSKQAFLMALQFCHLCAKLEVNHRRAPDQQARSDDGCGLGAVFVRS